MAQFDEFTERAREAVTLAQSEARRLGHGYVGSDHLLLGLLRLDDGVAKRSLVAMGVDIARLAAGVEFIIGRGECTIDGERPLSPRARRVIDLAIMAAPGLNHRDVGSEHLLLALLHEGTGVAPMALRGSGITLETFRAYLLSIRPADSDDPPSVRHPEPVADDVAAHANPRAGSRFDRFTERARKVVSLSQEEAWRFNHSYIGTEHLLLGLIHEGNGVAARVLSDMGIQLPKVRSAIEFLLSRGEGAVIGDIGLTPRAKKVFELAIDEARRLNHFYVGTEHLLLGLVREGEGIAAGVLMSLGLHLEMVREGVVEVIASEKGPLEAFSPPGEVADPPAKAPSPPFKMPFERLSAPAREVLRLAIDEAHRFNHNYIGTEHLLLGLVREGDGVAARVLGNMGVQLRKVRSAVDFIIGRGEGVVIGDIGLTPRAKNVLELAIDEASRLNHHYVGTEHLLLGLVREGEGIAAGVLESFGVDLARVRTEVVRLLEGGQTAC